MIYRDIEQGSDEWLALRCGKVTGSRVHAIIAKGGGAGRKTYMGQLIAERMTGQAQRSFKSAEMERGNEVEPKARAAYEFIKNVDVETVGFVDHPTIKSAGCSPDGLVGTTRGVEFKCPNTSTHIDTILGAAIKAEYRSQIQWNMACAELEAMDFVSFDDRMPAHRQAYIIPFARDDAFIKNLEEQVSSFIAEMEEKIARLSEIAMEQAA